MTENQTPDDGWGEFRDLVTGDIGMLLAGRDLREGGSYVKACHEIADVLRPWIATLSVRAAQRDRLVERDGTVLDEIERRLRAKPWTPQWGRDDWLNWLGDIRAELVQSPVGGES